MHDAIIINVLRVFNLNAGNIFTRDDVITKIYFPALSALYHANPSDIGGLFSQRDSNMIFFINLNKLLNKQSHFQGIQQRFLYMVFDMRP